MCNFILILCTSASVPTRCSRHIKPVIYFPYEVYARRQYDIKHRPLGTLLGTGMADAVAPGKQGTLKRRLDELHAAALRVRHAPRQLAMAYSGAPWSHVIRSTIAREPGAAYS